MADDSSSSENSFDLQTLLEPWPDENPRVPITRNVSQESSFQQRIRTFGNADEESPFLMGKNPIDFYKEVQESLKEASTQEEYKWILDFENTDLQVREIRKECFFLFLRTLGSPPLENSNEAILSFLESEREALEAELKDSGIHPSSLDQIEIHSLTKIKKDLHEKGNLSYYFHKFKREYNITHNRNDSA